MIRSGVSCCIAYRYLNIDMLYPYYLFEIACQGFCVRRQVCGDAKTYLLFEMFYSVPNCLMLDILYRQLAGGIFERSDRTQGLGSQGPGATPDGVPGFHDHLSK